MLKALSDDVVLLQAKYDLCTIRRCADTLKRLHEFNEMAVLPEREYRYYNEKKKKNVKGRSQWGGGVLRPRG